jgi:hypothetical protein
MTIFTAPPPESPTAGNINRHLHEGVRLRAILIGTFLALVICVLTPFNNACRQGTPLGGGHFPLAPFYLFIWMMVFSALIAKVFKGWRLLNGKELLVTWALMVLLSGIAWTGLARTFFINLTAPYEFATVENRWEDVLHPLLPQAWYPQNREAVKSFYNGFPGGRQMGWLEVIGQVPWRAWGEPLLTWTGFIMLCYFLMACIINIISRQSIYHERMNFPLLRVPLIMAESLDNNAFGRFLRNRYFLIGLMIPVGLHLLNGLSFYNPSIPAIPTSVIAGTYFPSQGLFSGFDKLKIFIYPAFIGFAFLTVRQISFSFWFFYIAGAFLIGALNFLGFNIPAASLGVTFGPTLSRPEEMQMVGAYIVFFIFLAWLARFHFSDVFKKGVRFQPDLPEQEGWLSMRTAFWGVILGSVGLIAWCHYFGVPLILSFLVVGVFFLFMLVAVRIICQGGLAYFTLTAAPLDGLMAFFSVKAFTHTGILVAAVLQKILFVDLRESLMPSLLHANKLTTSPSNRNRFVFITIIIVLLAGIAVSFLAFIALCYKYGARELGLDWATRTTLAVYDNVFSMVETPVSPGKWSRLFIIAGAFVMLILVICYHRFYWWPIHPIGYLTAYSSALWYLWFSFFIGWACNALCMRYGGVQLFKKVRHFFIGLIIGDFLMAGNWALYGLFSDFSYTVLPV